MTLRLSSLILLGPDEMLKMDDQSMSRICKIAGLESLFKGAEQVRRDPSQTVPSALQASLLSALDGFEAPHVKPFLQKLRRAIEGDADAQGELADVGAWQVWRIACAESSEEEKLLIDHFVEVEVASRDADACMAKSGWEEAAQLVRRDPLLGMYLGECARDFLAAASSPEQALPARVAGLLEVLLAQIARLDAWRQVRHAWHLGFRLLLQGNGGVSAGPGRALMRWLKDKAQARTLAQLVPNDGQCDLVSESTLKRWSSGKTFPAESQFREVVERRLEFVDKELRDELLVQARWMFFVARRLDKILRLAEVLFEAPLPGSPAPNSWGRALLDGDSALGWARKRYDIWLDHWTSQGARPLRS